MNQEFSESLADLLSGDGWQVNIIIESDRRSVRLNSKTELDTGEVIYIRRMPDESLTVSNGYETFTLPASATPANVTEVIRFHEEELRFKTVNILHRKRTLTRVLHALPTGARVKLYPGDYPGAVVTGDDWIAVVNVRRSTIQIDITLRNGKVPKSLFG